MYIDDEDIHGHNMVNECAKALTYMRMYYIGAPMKKTIV